MRYVGELALAVGLFFGQNAAAANIAFQAADQVHQAFDTGETAQKTSDALDGLIITATNRLREAGFEDDSNQIMAEYQNKYRGFVLRMHGIGDHAPIDWMLQVYNKLELMLGDRIVRLAHLDDIRIFAYTIPVVIWCEDNVDAPEFAKHFVGEADGGFAGSCAYWAAMAICTAGTYGTGYGVMCSPLGSLCEEITEKAIAPRLSPKVWAKSCGQ